MLGEIPGISDIPLSTNAHLLKQYAQELQNFGINRVNISIDSLQEKRFAEITRGGDLHKVIEGIDAAIVVGMNPIKLNMVVMQDINSDEIEAMLDFAIDREIDIRFIETMPIGADGIKALEQHVSQAHILEFYIFDICIKFMFFWLLTNRTDDNLFDFIISFISTDSVSQRNRMLLVRMVLKHWNNMLVKPIF
jgi:molybdenum cofactor biosynthesis enzyme MoaA